MLASIPDDGKVVISKEDRCDKLFFVSAGVLKSNDEIMKTINVFLYYKLKKTYRTEGLL